MFLTLNLKNIWFWSSNICLLVCWICPNFWLSIKRSCVFPLVERLLCVFFFSSCRDSCSFFVVCVVIYGKFGFGCSKETKSTRQNGCGPNIINNYKEESVNQLARYTHHTHTHTHLASPTNPPHPTHSLANPHPRLPSPTTTHYCIYPFSFHYLCNFTYTKKERKEKKRACKTSGHNQSFKQ
jgi:hypothetical protein